MSHPLPQQKGDEDQKLGREPTEIGRGSCQRPLETLAQCWVVTEMGPLPLSLPLSPPPIPQKMLTVDVIHLEEEFEFVHGAAVDEQGQCLLQLLKCDGATSIRVKQDEESLSKERLWPEEDGRWVQMWPWSLGFEFIHSVCACVHACVCVCVCVCVCTCHGVAGFREDSSD